MRDSGIHTQPILLGEVMSILFQWESFKILIELGAILAKIKLGKIVQYVGMWHKARRILVWWSSTWEEKEHLFGPTPQIMPD